MAIVLIWITSIIVSCIIADKNGRSVGAWFFLSLLFGFLATIVVLAMGPANPVTIAVASPHQPFVFAENRVPCPRCGESIVATAKICRFCSAAQAVNEWPTS